MGTPAPPPPETYPKGSDCSVCTPALYKTGEWPLYMFITFHDIVACPGYEPPPNNYTFKCKQGDILCTWGGTFPLGDITYDVLLDLSYSFLWLYRGTSPAAYYFWASADPCTTYFPINANSCPGDAGHLGRGVVRPTPSHILRVLTGQYHIMPWKGTMAEINSVAMDHRLVRLANKSDHSRIYVYLDYEDLPLP